MTEEHPLDLTALDPLRDPDHWDRVMSATARRVDAVLARRRPDPLATLAGWTRPVLIAAAIAVVLLVPIELALETREPQVEQVRRLVSLSVRWEPGERPPSGAEFLRALTAGEAP